MPDLAMRRARWYVQRTRRLHPHIHHPVDAILRLLSTRELNFTAINHVTMHSRWYQGRVGQHATTELHMTIIQFRLHVVGATLRVPIQIRTCITHHVSYQCGGCRHACFENVRLHIDIYTSRVQWWRATCGTIGVSTCKCVPR